MQKTLFTLLSLTALAFAYSSDPEHERDYTFQRGIENPNMVWVQSMKMKVILKKIEKTLGMKRMQNMRLAS